MRTPEDVVDEGPQVFKAELCQDGNLEADIED